jgi:hypothetical protein
MTAATGVLTALQRIGGPIGAALLALILEHQTRLAAASAGAGSSGLQPVTPTVRAHIADPLAEAFAHTFAWAAGVTAAAIISAALLARTERAAPAVRTR